MVLTRTCRDLHDGEKVISLEEICSSSLLTLKVVMKRNFANLKELAPKYEKCRAFSPTWPSTVQIYRNKSFYIRKGSTPTGLVWNINMAAVIFWFGTLIWRTWRHCFGTPLWRTWRHVKTLNKRRLNWRVLFFNITTSTKDGPLLEVYENCFLSQFSKVYLCCLNLENMTWPQVTKLIFWKTKQIWLNRLATVP